MSSTSQRRDHRRAAAERSIEAILDAAERLLASGGEASTSAVAAAAGVSRVTLYSHFPTRSALLEAGAERAVRRGAEAIASAELQSGDAGDALARLVQAAWGKLENNIRLFAAVRGELGEEALRRAHQQIDAPIISVIKRGQQTGAFTSSVRASWLLTVFYALMHAAADEVNSGRISRKEALAALTKTIHAAFRDP